MVHTLTTKTAFDGAITKDVLSVVDFYADWCGPCRMIAPKIEAMSKEYDAAKVVFFKVNVDDNEATSEACNIQCLPTFHIYRNGKLLAKVEGSNENAIKEEIEKNL